MIAISNLAKSYGAQTLFTNASIQFNPGNRYGLVGANGCGKSTLLRLLSGEEEPSAGTISMAKRLRLGVLRQDQFRFEKERIIDVVMMGDRELWDAMIEKELLLARSDQGFDGARYAELEDLILRHDGYAHEARAAEVLEGLGIPTPLHHHPISTLSGGFKLRVLLAQVLASTPDVLLLDEPTNHLDILSIRWLERFLSAYKGTTLVVSHDHRFLDNVCTHTVDIDYETATLYNGNYTAFTDAKVADRERKEHEIAKQERKIEEQKEFIERFKAKATKARQAQSKLKAIDKIDVEWLPQSSRRYPTFRFEEKRHSGKKVIELQGVSKSFGKKRVLTDVSLEINRGDRIAIIGPNGIGKSTLLKIMMSELPADEGTSEWGYETYPGYFGQEHGHLFKGSRKDVEEWLWDSCPGEPIGFVRGKLAMVLFSGDDVKKRVAALSGGEAARLLFAKLHVDKPNVLVLDEPTNHLDIEAIEALVKGLEAYTGTLIFVSHDRWFVSRLATRILELTPEGPRDYKGTYEEYLERCGDDHLDAEAVVLKAKRDKKKSREIAAPVDAKEQRQRDQRKKELERERDKTTKAIEQAESRVHDINEIFSNPGFFTKTNKAEVKKLENEQDNLRKKIAELMAKWEEIEAELV